MLFTCLSTVYQYQLGQYIKIRQWKQPVFQSQLQNISILVIIGVHSPYLPYILNLNLIWDSIKDWMDNN